MTEKFRNRYRIPSARASWWDYTHSGAYFVTLNTDNKKNHYFGQILNARMQLSAIGQIASECWLEISNYPLNPENTIYYLPGNHVIMITLFVMKKVISEFQPISSTIRQTGQKINFIQRDQIFSCLSLALAQYYASKAPPVVILAVSFLECHFKILDKQVQNEDEVCLFKNTNIPLTVFKLEGVFIVVCFLNSIIISSLPDFK